MKTLHMLLMTLTFLMNTAFASKLDCGTSKNDVIIKTFNHGRASIAFSMPDGREDKWFGPVTGKFHEVNELETHFFFDNGIIVKLWDDVAQDLTTPLTGTISFESVGGLQNLEIVCRI